SVSAMPDRPPAAKAALAAARPSRRSASLSTTTTWNGVLARWRASDANVAASIAGRRNVGISTTAAAPGAAGMAGPLRTPGIAALIHTTPCRGSGLLRPADYVQHGFRIGDQIAPEQAARFEP